MPTKLPPQPRPGRDPAPLRPFAAVETLQSIALFLASETTLAAMSAWTIGRDAVARIYDARMSAVGLLDLLEAIYDTLQDEDSSAASEVRLVLSDLGTRIRIWA